MHQFAQLMCTIRESHEQFESQLPTFEDKVRQGQKEAVTKALKRARHENPYQYGKKGNKEQARFNASVDEALAEAQVDLTGPGTLLALECAY